LEPDQTAMGEVVVSAGSFEASDKATGATMNPIDVVTTAGSNGDVANAMRALPGAQQIGDQEGLFIRGGSGDEAKQFIDGTLYKSPNFSSIPGLIQPARLSPFLFKGITFSSGGYSALYGEALSGALIMESDDLPEKSSYLIGGSPILGTAGFQNLSKNGNYSYGVSARYVNYYAYSQVVPQQPDYFHGPEFIGGDANFRIKLANDGMFKIYVNSTYNDIGFTQPDIDSSNLKSSFQVKGINIYNNVSYRQPLGENWKIDIGTTYNYNSNNITNKILNPGGEQVFIPNYPFDIQNSNVNLLSNFENTKVVVTRFLENEQALRFGAEQSYSSDRYTFSDTTTTVKDNLFAVFAETDIHLAKNMALKTRLRFEHSTLFDKSNLAPRISFAYRLNDGGQVNLAYGIFYQKPDYNILYQSLLFPISSAEFNTQFDNLNFTSATHYIVNYTRKVDNRLFRAEIYYKSYSDLVETYPVLNNKGNGYAKGIELFWRDKKTFKDFDYWITYTYLDTKRQYLNYPSLLQPNFATPHTVSLVAKKYIEAINISCNASYSVATGRPFYDIRYNQSTDQPEIYDQGKTNPYQSLNLSITYMLSFFKKWKSPDFTFVSFGMNNVLGSNPVFGYTYSYDGTNKVPITLPAPRTIFIGIFMTFGINRSEDFMNQNL